MQPKRIRICRAVRFLAAPNHHIPKDTYAPQQSVLTLNSTSSFGLDRIFAKEKFCLNLQSTTVGDFHRARLLKRVCCSREAVAISWIPSAYVRSPLDTCLDSISLALETSLFSSSAIKTACSP